MTWEIITGLIGFAVAMIAIVTPIVKLNVNIGKLNATIEMLSADTQQKHNTLDKRVTKHGEQIDELEKITVSHDIRITNIESGKRK